eukprot:TRINITY_DN27779_c0_g1_i1.p1 TRINITY_DN27779_c0_g1~~TRINITY_DN27779_c0_g1_i1.p1  ORF type:complete len:844 (+),score=202.32 TRINITY_DN27779_c0_g1_i1:160-2691(+)
MAVVVQQPPGPTQDFQSLVLTCNKDGMESLRRGQLKAAFEQFKYAEAILIANQMDGHNTSLLAVTCNNLGCYYKKVGKLHGALSYLRRALRMEVELDTDEVTLSGTHLNICAILSKLDKHDKAVQHAHCALDLIKKRVHSASGGDRVSQDDYSVLAIAYHNVAVERDFLQEFEKAASAFQEGHQVARRHLGEEHPLSIALGKNCDAVLQKSRKLGATSLTGRIAAKADKDLASRSVQLPSIPGAAPRLEDKAYQSIPFNDTTLKLSMLDKIIPNKAPTPVPIEDDIVDAESGSRMVTCARSAPNDYRPNRMIKGATRTARVVRRTGLSNNMVHRDQVVSGKPLGVNAATASIKEAYRRKLAAERIQRAWRAWSKYYDENGDWMHLTWNSATCIQAHWRSYHVRRQRKDCAATCIQRHARGYLVRRYLRRRKAAVAIQRHMLGVLARMQMRKLQVAATKIQSLARGAAARRRVRARRAFLTKTVVTIQCCMRQFFARRRVDFFFTAKSRLLAQRKGATDIQRLFRGVKGRARARDFRAKYMLDKEQYQAATKLQAMARRDRAIKRVDKIRDQELQKMGKAATHIRKMWMGFRARKRYKQLLVEFAAHEDSVRTMQRYARGFLVRLRMWREAIRAEEELWATMEIQRVWRGYRGRVRFEDKCEQVWRREMVACLIQRNLRGWLARTRVGRLRRRLARVEFERARRRFRAAQRIQALARGVLSRKVTNRRWWRKRAAAATIQRIFRGHRLRQKLWKQVIALRATMIQAAMRGFLVRNRHFHLCAVVVCIQRAFRHWQCKPAALKDAARQERQLRKEKAKVIQDQFRKQQEEKELERAREATGASTG